MMLKSLTCLLTMGIFAVAFQSAEAAKAKKPGTKSAEARLAKADTDKDGKISREEFAAKFGEGGEQFTAKRFSKQDRNDDGYLTVEELKAAAETRQKKQSKKKSKK